MAEQDRGVKTFPGPHFGDGGVAGSKTDAGLDTSFGGSVVGVVAIVAACGMDETDSPFMSKAAL